MGATAQRLCAYSGFVLVIIFITGFGFVAGFIPPPSPSDSAAEIGELYRGDQDRIRVGMVISLIAAALSGPWVAVMTVQLRRIEGMSVVVLTQFALGTLLVLEFILFLTFWQVAAFRTDRPDTEIQLMNDLAWIPFIGLTSTAILQCGMIATVILRDRAEQPSLPRWVAYANIWVGLCFVPGTWNCLFKDGPVAWDGVLSYWVAMFAFLSWFFVNSYGCLLAIRRAERDGTIDHTGPNRELDEVRAELASLRRELDSTRA